MINADLNEIVCHVPFSLMPHRRNQIEGYTRKWGISSPVCQSVHDIVQTSLFSQMIPLLPHLLSFLIRLMMPAICIKAVVRLCPSSPAVRNDGDGRRLIIRI
jgi:hypothetical protein